MRATRKFYLALLIMCWGAESAPPALGETVRYVDAAAPGPAHDGSSWCQAYTDLRAALAAAAAGDELRVADGVYKPSATRNRTHTFQLKSGVAVRGGFAGCGAADPDDRDPGFYVTILSGDLIGDDGPAFTNIADNSFHVVSGAGADATALLEGVTITAGNADGIDPDDRGAGIRNYFVDGAPVFRNCIIRGNNARKRGGGVYNDTSSASYINCVIAGNRTLDPTGGLTWGGGMYNSDTASPTVLNCTFVGNTSRNTGGVFNSGNTAPTIVNCILWGNADNGGMDESAQIVPGFGRVSLTYSCVQGLTRQFFHGAGNTGGDPNFADFPGLDGLAGTADDDLHPVAPSSAINTGDPAFAGAPGAVDLDGAPRLQGCRVDLGAYESAHPNAAGDFDGDGGVTMRDAAAFQLCHATPAANPAWAAACLCVFDFNSNGGVELADFRIFRGLMGLP
ncbi:MAG: right-handed parallel beta-helix repeat-containing protein [Planctomycetes bacterium]|nr:right-handed parallel beta-helix repeat-containing protein [Planctomycetota bacterium]